MENRIKPLEVQYESVPPLPSAFIWLCHPGYPDSLTPHVIARILCFDQDSSSTGEWGVHHGIFHTIALICLATGLENWSPFPNPLNPACQTTILWPTMPFYLVPNIITSHRTGTWQRRDHTGLWRVFMTIGQDGITQRRRGPVKVVYSGCLSSRPTSGVYIYMSEHPHLCTDMLD